jgi:hypothetical protein
MANNRTPESSVLLIIMSVGALNALLGTAIVSIYFGLLPINIPYFNVPNWVMGLLGITWFLSGIGVVAFAAMRVEN